MELSASTAKPPLFTSTTFCSLSERSTPSILIIPSLSLLSVLSPHQHKTRRSKTTTRRAAKSHCFHVSPKMSSIANAEVEVEVAEGYTMTQFCDKIIDVFLNEKPKVKDWKKLLVLRQEWKKYREGFYSRCQIRADREADPAAKQKLVSLASKVKKIDDEMENHSQLLKEIQDFPTDLNAIVTRRRKDFTREFFHYLTLLWETYDSLEDRDGNDLASFGTLLCLVIKQSIFGCHLQAS
uniref:Uncharacterized protein MANES_12G121300 n=1 Tax=Rhizophora mucronata TaxID=61149 RepID=A0A2P2KN63_RHIMU